MAKNNYKYGRKKEKLVEKRLKNKGYKTQLSPGSRSPCDVKARKGSKKWLIQVKSSRSSTPNSMSKEEKRRLRIKASKSNALPVLAQVKRGKIQFKSLKSGRKLKP